MTQVASMAEWTSLHAKAGNKAVDILHDLEQAEIHEIVCDRFPSPELFTCTLDNTTPRELHRATHVLVLCR